MVTGGPRGRPFCIGMATVCLKRLGVAYTGDIEAGPERGPCNQEKGPIMTEHNDNPIPQTEQPASPQTPAQSVPQQQPQAQPGAQPQSGTGASQVPPTQPGQPYAQAQQHQPYEQPMYAQPVYPPAPLTKLSGGMKFAWFVIGALVGIPGILLAWVCNADKYPQVKNDAVKFSAIGFAVWMLAGIIFTVMIGGMLAAFVAAVDPGYYGTYGGTW